VAWGRRSDRDSARSALAAINIRARQAHAFPEEPAVGRARHFSHLDIALRRGLVDSSFPARDRHGGYVQLASEIGLVESHAVPQLFNLRRPHWFGKSCSGSHLIFRLTRQDSAGVMYQGSCSLQQSVTIGDAEEYIKQTEPTRDEIERYKGKTRQIIVFLRSSGICSVLSPHLDYL